MRFKAWLLAMALLSCAHNEASAPQHAPVLEIPSVPHSPSAPASHEAALDEKADSVSHFNVSEQAGFLFIKFDVKKLPPGAFFIEATYGENYLGYFVVGETVVVAKPAPGTSRVLLYYLLDGLGKRIVLEPYAAVLP